MPVEAADQVPADPDFDLIATDRVQLLHAYWGHDGGLAGPREQRQSR